MGALLKIQRPTRLISYRYKAILGYYAREYTCTHPSQVLHYVEKPGTFVSSTVNAGAYLFTPDIFDHLGQVFAANHQNELM